jgi:hypothetical protein
MQDKRLHVCTTVWKLLGWFLGKEDFRDERTSSRACEALIRGAEDIKVAKQAKDRASDRGC